jgi:hypothetical protein
MTVHEQFLALTVGSFVATVWAIVWAFRRHFAARRWIASYYAAGYVMIAAAFILDEVFAPPLFLHGFVPGIGIALIIEALLLTASEAFARTDADRHAALWVGIIALCGLAVLLTLAWFGVLLLTHVSLGPSARFAYGMSAGIALGALIGALGLRRCVWRDGRQLRPCMLEAKRDGSTRADRAMA